MFCASNAFLQVGNTYGITIYILQRYEGSNISLASGNWTIRLFLNSEASVIEESREIAQILPGMAAAIARCNRRVEVSSAPDPNMDYFNDYVFVIHVLESFEGVITLDPREPCFI